MLSLEEFKKLLEETNKSNNEILREEIKKGIKDEIKKGIKEELDNFKKEIKQELKEDARLLVAASLSKTESEISELKGQLKEKDEVISALQTRTLSLEFSSRSKNVVLFKVLENEIDSQSLRNGVGTLIRSIADPSFKDSDIEEVFRLGKKGAAPRPIMLRLKEFTKKNFLLSLKSKFIAKNVGIQEDLPKEVVDWRKSLYEVADGLRSEGRKVSFRRDKFLVDGIELNAAQIEEEVQKLRKRGRSISPEAESVASKRPYIRKLSLTAKTPKSQQSNIEKFYSPVMNPNMNKVFDFVVEDK